MRHKLGNKKLNKTSSHRAAMFSNMAVSLVMHEQIKTTLPKAKELRRYVERLVTVAKKGDLSARRMLISKIKDKFAAEKLISVLAKRYDSRHGGYTRVLKAGFRFGDMAPVAYIEFVDRDYDAKGIERPEFIESIKEQSQARIEKSKKASK